MYSFICTYAHIHRYLHTYHHPHRLPYFLRPSSCFLAGPDSLVAGLPWWLFTSSSFYLQCIDHLLLLLHFLLESLLCSKLFPDHLKSQPLSHGLQPCPASNSCLPFPTCVCDVSVAGRGCSLLDTQSRGLGISLFHSLLHLQPRKSVGFIFCFFFLFLVKWDI